MVGATGLQGGGLVRAILADPDQEFAVRALARNPRSAKAQALGAAGAEVVEADLNDQDSMVRAFQGAHGAYVVTIYWGGADTGARVSADPRKWNCSRPRSRHGRPRRPACRT